MRANEAEFAARTLAVQLQFVQARSPVDFDRAFAEMTKARAEALMVLTGAMFFDQRRRIVELIINLKTAKALGITLPLSPLEQADEVIQQWVGKIEPNPAFEWTAFGSR